MNADDAEEFARGHNNIGMVPAAIFTGGLDFDQEVTLQTLIEAMDRGEKYISALASGNEEMMHHFEPLFRLLSGIANGSVIPILQRINEGSNPVQAFKEVLAGIGGLTFFAGMEYAQSMGLNGVGVSLPERKSNADKEGNYYPEQKPPPVPDDFSLEQFLSQIATGDDDEEDN